MQLNCRVLSLSGMIIPQQSLVCSWLCSVPSGADCEGKIPNDEPTFGAAFEAFKDPSQLLTIQFLIDFNS